jgi:hypothetical protein
MRPCIRRRGSIFAAELCTDTLLATPESAVDGVDHEGVAAVARYKAWMPAAGPGDRTDEIARDVWLTFITVRILPIHPVLQRIAVVSEYSQSVPPSPERVSLANNLTVRVGRCGSVEAAVRLE